MLEKFKQDLNQTPFVFVYGTLKSGYGNNRLLWGSKQVAIRARTTRGDLALQDGGFPYLIDGDGDVLGEVYKVDNPKVLKRLDQLEGVGYGHYERIRLETKFICSNMAFDCWAYKKVGQPINPILCEKSLGFYKWG